MLNCVVLVGRLTRDPELVKAASGTSIASFRIAVDDSYKGPNGEKTTLFMDCVIYGNKADNVVKYVRKGSLISVQGRLRQRSYTNKSGVQVTVVETVADNVEFLEPKNASGARDAGYTPDVPAPSVPSNQAVASEDLDSLDVVDDDMPF